MRSGSDAERGVDERAGSGRAKTSALGMSDTRVGETAVPITESWTRSGFTEDVARLADIALWS